MHLQVRYVKSSDGTRLAVATLGEGQPLVLVPTTYTASIEGLWEMPEIRRNLERLAETRKVVVYDCRGVGLSIRDVEDFRTDALEHDLEAVIHGVGSSTIDLFAITLAGPATISFAAHNPERVRKLVLFNTASRGPDIRGPNEMYALQSLIDVNWELYIQTQSLVLYGWTDVGRRWAERLSSDVSKEVILKSRMELQNADASGLLTQLRCLLSSCTGARGTFQ